MIDCISPFLWRNIKNDRKVKQTTAFYGIPVEAELGALKGKEEDIINEAECKTDPDMVADLWNGQDVILSCVCGKCSWVMFESSDWYTTSGEN
mgnify:CR=1 FL=1